MASDTSDNSAYSDLSHIWMLLFGLLWNKWAAPKNLFWLQRKTEEMNRSLQFSLGILIQGEQCSVQDTELVSAGILLP